MPQLKEMAADFLAQKRIAVAGVSRTNHNAPANLIYRKLRDSGHEVFAINPNASTVEHDACFRSLKSLPKEVDAVVIATAPEVAETLVRDCADAGVARVWLHRSFGQGSVSEEAVAFCREHKMTVIAGGCPMMYCQPIDWGHRCMRWALSVTGGLPK
jgi:hypothetical protein